MTQITEHFTLEELTVSPTAKKLGISNMPTPEHIENMKHVCENILEKVREHYGKPVKVNSCYRSPALNAKVKGSKTSQHCNGEAIDFEVPGVPNKELADWVADNLEFDQVILEFYNPKEGPGSGWVHASLKRNGQNRRQRLIATKSAKGGTVYTPVADFDPSTAPVELAHKVISATKPAVKPAVVNKNPIAALQEKCGVTADGVFGPGTMKAAMAHFKMTPTRAAHFFAQTCHESGHFKAFSENLNYSDKGLHGTFRKYFPTLASTAGYARNPEKIANKVYGGRMGNGPESSGDGWKFRGRGALQLTGKDNYAAFAKFCGRPEIMDNPDIVAGELAFESALFFFERNKLWSVCDLGVNDAVILAVTKKINGGTIGLEERKALTRKFAAQLQ